MRVPKVITTNANMEYGEVLGVVTVGEEHAKILSQKLGREVKAGEQFDLGTLAVYHKNPFKNFWANVKLAIKRHEFS